MPHAISPTTEEIISDILNWVCPNVVDPWADVAMHLSVKVNVERTGATCGSSA
jgi:hypothetical protein